MSTSRSSLARTSLTSLRMLAVFTLLLGVVYPAVIWVAGLLSPNEANGSFIKDASGTVVGSSLIGQEFTGAEWFHGRPSASDYDALSSGASNLAATSDELATQIAERREAVVAEDGVSPSEVPADALTASGSGLDPHISPEYANLQVERVATATGLAVEQVQALVDEATEPAQLGFIGSARVNVVLLNLALSDLREATPDAAN